MITQETAMHIFNCHREIAVGQKLLEDIRETMKCDSDRSEWGKLPDAFGRRHFLQLSVPSGDDCHRLFQVGHDLAIQVIESHIAKMRVKLAEVNEQAKSEAQQ